MHTTAIYLCGARRTAIGAFNGALSNVPATLLGSTVLEAVIEQLSLPKESVEQVIMGCVLTAGTGQAPARQAALGAGLPPSVQALTVNKVCSSGLKAVMLAADAIRCGHADAILAGGMENMSRAPYLLPKLRAGARLGHTTCDDSLILDALWDVYNDFHMGNAAELCAKEYGLSREAQDAYAIESYTRARHAQESGFFKEEICAMNIRVGKEVTEFLDDEEPARANLEKISSLRTAFVQDGTVTAANASSINDGAAAMLVCSERYMNVHRLEPLARLHAQGWSGQAPEWFTTAPVSALRNALARAGKEISEIDLFELNEAFAAVALACNKDLHIPVERLNISGGAVALGHPVGASGARILTTLLYSLKRRGGKWGAAAICNGGGEATAVVVERC